MECTKCKKKIVPGQKYHRTKRGPHHQDCSNVQGTPAVAVQRGVVPLKLHEALCAIMVAVHSVHLTMGATPLFNRTHLEQDALLIKDALKKVGKLKRHNEKLTDHHPE